MGSRKTVIQQLAHIQAELLGTSFTQIGSLYEDVGDPTSSRFYVGPSAPPVLIEHPKISRGPWSTSRMQMRDFMTEQLHEILSDEEKVRSARKRNGAVDSPSDIEGFKALMLRF
jgi:hypothetical protein